MPSIPCANAVLPLNQVGIGGAMEKSHNTD